MKNSILILFLLLSGLLISCDQKKSTETSVESAPMTVPVASTDSIQPQISGSENIPVTESMPAPTVQTAAAGLNPAHGEPGHRCDIAVGAPLNSPPGKTATPAPTEPTIISTPQQTMPSAAPSTPPTNFTKVPTAPGMNPPHGEPGHDCSIAVGAPLKK